MATKDQVNELVRQGLGYAEIGRRLNTPPGLAYLIGTGMPVDGSDTYTEAQRERTGALSSAQHLLGVTADNPSRKQVVLDWIRARVRDDEPMRRAHTARVSREKER
ncbi:MAG: hypothetical protein J2P20_09900 [Pseudonocardia sp.]|nr:hypothetical protein [Pseudonocardia sp.]MBO0875855.1 hypothetical protein [Pseudonocardia sp.]